MREDAMRIARECNAPYPQPVHTAGYIHRGVEDDSTGAIRGLYHPAFRAPCFAEFMSSPEVLDFVRAWSGLEKEDLGFSSAPLIFCSGNSGSALVSCRRNGRRAVAAGIATGAGGAARTGR